MKNEDDADKTPTDSPTRPPGNQSDANMRPHLLRSAPTRLSELDHSLEEGSSSDTSSTSDVSPGTFEPGKAGSSRALGIARVKNATQISQTQEDLARLREAVMLNQHRVRTLSSGPVSKGLKRVSPIKEEGLSQSPGPGDVDPAIEPDRMRSMSSTSVTSTESQRTVRGVGVGALAGQTPIRTPSYPFPYIPGSPRAWQTMHQPFMTLSPTVPAQESDALTSTPLTGDTHRTPVGSMPTSFSAFLPRDAAALQPPEDPRFSSPNIYETVLQLNAEPGIEQWWTTVTNLMHDRFMAERATLVVPMDPTDVENVPWGQKATFSKYGREDIHQSSQVPPDHAKAKPDSTLRELQPDAMDDFRPQKLHPERLRPRLESRHSYAGHGREARDITETPAEQPDRINPRPAGPKRTVTHAPGMDRASSCSKRFRKFQFRRPTQSEMEFSSVAGADGGAPYAEVFTSLLPLDHEDHALIESHGVSRVVNRGGVVTVTRDYASDVSDESNSPVNASDAGRMSKMEEDSAHGSPTATTLKSGNADQAEYRDFEQPEDNTWARSPAPSPAVQADEDRNPFFAAEEESVDDSFANPNISPNDFVTHIPPEAIGVDYAATVLHIPLIHPTLSQALSSHTKTPQPDPQPSLRRSSTFDREHKAPLAILSILVPHVPFPPSLLHSLRLLGPHLATSFSTSLQFSTLHPQALSIRHRRTASGNMVPNAPMTIAPASLDDIMQHTLGRSLSSVTESMTSPSDYSGRSRHSPGSVLDTPGWDSASGGWSKSRSVVGTPAASSAHEKVESYFDSARRPSSRPTAQTAPAKHRTSIHDTRDGSQKTDNDSVVSHGRTMKDSSPVAGREDRPPTQSGKRASDAKPGTRSAQSTQASRSSDPTQPKQHSLLHSYGADWHASFGAVVFGEPPKTPGGGHARAGSYSEDMPPPSERLLRTIIDSLPVQIFTAEPATGQLSWVNQKFLNYRQREPKDVLSKPWETMHPHDQESFAADWHRSLRTNEHLQQKVRLQRFDGQYRWFYVRAAPLKDRHQKVVHWIGTMMDFHEQHLAEANSLRQQETAASEAKYRALANSSPQIVFAVNRKAGVTFCNSQWLHYSGQTEAQALGVGFMDQVHPDDLAKCRLPIFDEISDKPINVPTSVPTDGRRKVSTSALSSSASSESDPTVTGSEAAVSPIANLPQRQLSELASTGILKASRDADGRPSYSTEVRLKSKDSVYRWHLVRVLLAAPALQINQAEETWYGTCTDINDHKTLERDLKETMDEKSRFLSNMSHEIRTPLNGITGMVNFLIDSSLTAEQMEHVNIIRASTEGLRGLINDILDLSKAEAGMIQLNMDWLHVRALIEEVNDLTSTMAIDKGLQLNYLVDENVPSQVKGDRFRIRQIMLNVVGNAIKFTKIGEVFIRCSLKEDTDGTLAQNEMYIKFEVVDTGRGFNEKEAEFLFKRFSQIDGSSTRQHGGTGLGLVISRQLAQLHGGDMSARGVPNQGATFMFYIKMTVPSKHDRPPMPLTPSTTALPLLVGNAAQEPTVGSLPPMIQSSSAPPLGKPSPKFSREFTQSPSPHSPTLARDSPSASSVGSDPSLRSAGRTNSTRSARSSASSLVPDIALSTVPMKLALPTDHKLGRSASVDTSSSDSLTSANSGATLRPGSNSGILTPPMFSILVVAPLMYSREATVQHIDKTLPSNVPHQITARESFAEVEDMLGGDEPVIFTHIVLVLQDVDEILALMKHVLSKPTSSTSLVIITDLAQRRRIMEREPTLDYEKLVADRKLRFVFKPLKPSRLGLIFDPQKEREMSTDRNQDSAQQVAVSQKAVFEELTRRLGHREKRVLLVEDNQVNQMVILKFLSKVAIPVEVVVDGVQCTERVFAQAPGYYSIILCDLHMPNKDGYQTCKDLRRWEAARGRPAGALPIIALSANVLGDVYQKCVDAGFNSYVTKPVDFKELSKVLMTFMDPVDSTKPHPLMRRKEGHRTAAAGGK